MWWLPHLLGFDSSVGTDLWGGVLSVFFTVLPLLIAYYWHHNCHVHHCWRIGKHAVDGTPYVVCRKHHPTISNGAPTAEDVKKASSE